jgi:Intracellular proteinase inhibitor
LTPLVLLALAAAVGRQPDSMRVEIVVPPTVAVGEPVPIAIRIANTADRPIELHLRGRTTVFDLTVSRGDSVVWRRLEGEVTPAILQLRSLAPGEVLELKDTWEQRNNTGSPVGSGEYVVSGVVPTDSAPIRAGPVALVVGG